MNVTRKFKLYIILQMFKNDVNLFIVTLIIATLFHVLSIIFFVGKVYQILFVQRFI